MVLATSYRFGPQEESATPGRDWRLPSSAREGKDSGKINIEIVFMRIAQETASSWLVVLYWGSLNDPFAAGGDELPKV